MKNARSMPKVLLRLDERTKQSLAGAAQSNFRSLNSEINARLTESLKAEKEKPQTFNPVNEGGA
jgi:hypothetical protein